jgi:hypothetical protein
VGNYLLDFFIFWFFYIWNCKEGRKEAERLAG